MIKRVVIGAGIAAAGWATYMSITRWRATWGVVDEEALKALPGDDLVANALSTDTRGITIEAPPELVWPWLVQMGYERGGWYSIDQLDMRGSSATTIVDAWQGLAVGDILPTHPGGGFVVRELDPGRALVVYADGTTMQPSNAAAPADVPAGLAASGAFLSTTPSDFAASWAFGLEPIGTSGTRLIERVRYLGAQGNAVSNVALSFLGFGVFVMIQRQLIGIRDRAERLAIERSRPAAAPASPQPATGNGHEPDLAGTVISAGPA